MHHDSTPSEPRSRLLRRSLVAASYALAGLCAAPLVVFTLGWLTYGGRPSWHEGQGEGFVVTLFALYAAPFGAAFGALAGFALDCIEDPGARRRARWSALALFLALAAAGFTVLARA